ncbi:MAG TPA: O-antigen ligase family protein [Devosiaceae bacterium]|jgi:O-antigen ligase|nr:O-antigen ligase family protein [Devosiaceae bacterium]
MADLSTLALRRALLPFLVIGTLVFPYVGGALWAYTLILISLAATLVHLLPPRAFRLRAGDLLFIGAFLLILCAYAITGRPGTNDVLYAVNFAVFLFFAPLRSLFTRFAGPRNSLQVASLALLGSTVAAVIALFQVLVQGLGRAEGFGSNPIPSSTAALLLGFIALMGFLSESSRRRYIYLLGPVLGLFVVYLGGSRGPMLGGAALLVLTLLTVPRRRWVGAATLVAIAAVGLAAILAFPERFERVLSLPAMLAEIAVGEETMTDESADIRYRILRGSIRAFADAPIFGHGWAAKTAVVDSHLQEGVFDDSPQYHLHSDVLNLAVSAGLLGLLAYVLVLVAPALAVHNSPRDGQLQARRFGVSVLIVGYGVCGAVNLLFGFEFMTTFYVLISALLAGYCQDAATTVATVPEVRT